jgi:hypothetical protein
MQAGSLTASESCATARRPTQRAVDAVDSAAFLSIFLAFGFVRFMSEIHHRQPYRRRRVIDHLGGLIGQFSTEDGLSWKMCFAFLCDKYLYILRSPRT